MYGPRKTLLFVFALAYFVTLPTVATAQLPACSETAPELEAVGSRYLKITLEECIGNFAVRLLGEGSVRCVDRYLQADKRLGAIPVFQSYEAWGGVLYLRGVEVVPDSTYKVLLEESPGISSLESLPATTWRWAHTVNRPSSFPGLDALMCALNGAAGVFQGECTPQGADLAGDCGCSLPDRKVNQNDVDAVLDASAGHPFPCVGPCCTISEDFEGGANGWQSSGDCSTGHFVVDTPTLMENGAITTQVGGDHSRDGAGNAIFTARNTAIGSDDVDRGTCILTSPFFPVDDDSEVSVWFFHGQRDAGDDPNDGFVLEMSTDAGESWFPMETSPGISASFGDVAVNAVWTRASAIAPSGSEVFIRLQVTDGTGPGDIVEAGLDDFLICPAD